MTSGPGEGYAWCFQDSIHSWGQSLLKLYLRSPIQFNCKSDSPPPLPNLFLQGITESLSTTVFSVAIASCTSALPHIRDYPLLWGPAPRSAYPSHSGIGILRSCTKMSSGARGVAERTDCLFCLCGGEASNPIQHHMAQRVPPGMLGPLSNSESDPQVLSWE